MTHPIDEARSLATRRQFLARGASCYGLGAAALHSLLTGEQTGTGEHRTTHVGGINEGLRGLPHAVPKARRVIYLFQSGAPSQMDLLDYKPSLEKLDGTELPASIRMGQRLTGMTSRQSKFTVTKSPWKFRQCGDAGIWLSDLLPWHQRIADHMCLVKTMHTEAINHDPAITFVQSGHQQPGRPCLGSWASYGLGSQAKDLPAFVVLLSKCTDNQAQPLYSRLWGSGFLPSNHQGVKLRGSGDPVLYLNDPTGESLRNRRTMLDDLARLNELHHGQVGDPEVQARIAAYEMAYRMQISVPGLLDFSDEPASTWELYGEDAKIPGTHAANCLLARRLAERDVRFIQLYHRGWDHHSNLPGRHPGIARQVDRGSAALVLDLLQRGLLDDTLVVWGGEFGRTVYAQGSRKKFGRDHHPRCFSVWMAGGGVRAGYQHGQTDDFCYNIAEDGVHVHDLNATILHLLGVNHERLVYRFQGRDYRLTDVHGKVVAPILA
ncbi:MAG: DUF1501 domain-containing protein [Planctomycetota bacterium]|nr:DUF1501 domain-containing protein [Planctomycetota bacterium]